MKPNHELILRRLLVMAETGSASAIKMLERLAALSIRTGELPPILRNFVADRLEGKRKPKASPNRDRDIALCRAHLAGETIESLAERTGVSDRHISEIVSRYRDYCEATAALEKMLIAIEQMEKESCLSPFFEVKPLK